MKASSAQAKLIASLWGRGKGVPVNANGRTDATTLACIKRGWLSPTMKRGTFPNGDEFIEYQTSLDGLDALEQALAEARRDRLSRPIKVATAEKQ